MSYGEGFGSRGTKLDETTVILVPKKGRRERARIQESDLMRAGFGGSHEIFCLPGTSAELTAGSFGRGRGLIVWFPSGWNASPVMLRASVSALLTFMPFS